MKSVALALVLTLTACAGKKGDPAPVTSQQEKSVRKNRLAKARSPYLRQHETNPVDWFEWGAEAFEKAEREDKPVFLSIGYSTCHWCHVMAHESFENEAIAKLMNEQFVSIKVDREERPDIDQVYMTAAQMLTGSGGWPLSVWLTPEKKPFYAGTYFPPEDRWGRSGFPTLLKKIAALWKSNRQELVRDAERLAQRIGHSSEGSSGELDPKLLERAFEQLRGEFDSQHAGFGGAPKFPRSIVLEFLFRHHRRTGSVEALEMAEKTLRAMRAGGMYDQLGGGFHRYSTDERWLVPHFEKMLYDNALLARAYAQAWQITKKEEYANTVRETLDYVLRDMTSKEGAFFSAEDADSLVPETARKAEGYFYVWNREQVNGLVPGRDGEILCRALGVTQSGNFESPHPGDPKGMSVLHLGADEETLSKEFSLPVTDVRKIVRQGKAKLEEARRRRPRPHLDDKILADWNGLMIGALAYGGSILGELKYVEAAERAARVLLEKMRRSDGRWWHVYKDGSAAIDAFVDDYAALSEGFFLLHQATFRTEYAEVALRTAELMIAEFGDAAGGFFQTGTSGEKLIARVKESYDGALPSGNSVAALALFRLSDLATRADFRKKAEDTLRFFAGGLAKSPTAYPYHLCAVDALVGPSQEVVIAGVPDEMLRVVRCRFLPNTVVALVADEKTRSLIPMTADRAAIEGKPTAYVCSNGACKLPAKSAEELARQLDGR